MKRGIKGQTTVFIVIGIAVVIIALLLFYLNFGNKIEKDYEFDIQPVSSFIDSCLESSLKAGVNYVGFQGGYYNKPVISKYYNHYNIPYYWYDNENSVPEIKTIEDEISKYIENYFSICIDDFKNFENSKYEIEQEEISVETTINNDDVEIDVDYPVVIKFQEKSVNINEFSSDTTSNLKKAYDASRLIIEEQEKTPDEMPLGFIVELADENGFTFETVTDGNEIIYSLIFGENNGFIYNFVANYEWEVENEE
ncbi:hypothetical protein GF386_04180 [Candidatus Pacearchaeota archaeon]|nr:hypothetical protein [Candidatus Pacearchaeota archaeon]